MKKALATITPAIGYLTLAATALAQNIGVAKPDEAKITDIGTLIGSGISLVIIVAGILIFIYLVWGGLQWMMSGGDKGKVEEARSRITAALVGLAIVAAAWALSQLISTFFGTGGGLGSPLEVPKAYE